MLEKIKIGGMEYQVKEIKFGESNGDVTLGECHFETADILINENLSDKRKEQTLVHEMVHAMLFECGSIEYDNEELVNQMGLIMYQILKDNDLKLSENKEDLIRTKDGTINVKKLLGLHNPNDVFRDKRMNQLREQF